MTRKAVFAPDIRNICRAMKRFRQRMIWALLRFYINLLFTYRSNTDVSER